ncbi:glycosyltransferase family 4 protein [Aquibium carbonis]|uniref:glycosyltransferase family 4 protein n=1 Tax=Aquibium carbonis TaxID=2495581 RepID=UPI00147913D8|nr:glycosyltransferase family 4 protein [Aquibium carbonis]
MIPYPHYGGGERLVSLICRSLRADGYQVELRIDTRRSLAGSSLGDWFDGAVDGWRTFGSDDPAAAIAAIAEPDTAAVVWCNFPPAIAFATALSAARRSLRQVAFLFNSTDGRDRLRVLAPCIDVVIAESLDVMTSVGEMRLDGPPTRLIPSAPAVTAVTAVPRPRRDGRDGRRLLVGFIGRMDPIKDPHAVLRVAALLPKAEFAFVLAGSGEMQRRVRWDALRLSLRRHVRWRGRLDDDALARQFAALDVLLVPSLLDGRPLVVQEAQRRGVTVVASRVGGIPELVEDGSTGLLCEPGDHVAFAEALRRLRRDPTLRRSLADEALRRVEAQEPLAARLARYKEAITGAPATPAASPPSP